MAKIPNRTRTPSYDNAALMESDLEEFRKMLVIDKHGLDDILTEQPDLIFQISEKVSALLAERDAAKLAVAEEEAEAGNRLRAEAEASEKKITVAQVEAAVKLDENVTAAQQRFAKLVHACNRWNALKEAFFVRKDAINTLANLYANNYWSGGRDGHGKDKRDQMRQAVQNERKRVGK